MEGMKRKNNLAFYEFIMKVHAISKIGLTYSQDPYALENYEELATLSQQMLKQFTKVKFDRPFYFAKDVYPTPNVSVRMLIFNDQQELLMVKEKVDGGYTVPGGWADLYESPVEAITKECLQEAGATVKVTKLVGVYHFDFFHRGQAESQYALVFTGQLKGPLAPFGHEITEVKFFPLNQLPKNFSHKLTKADLLRMLKDAQRREAAFE
jgi:8-oxo-dGTP diphosphatase